MTNKLTLTSRLNPNWNVVWYKGQVEHMMQFHDVLPSNNYDWIWWIINFVVDGDTQISDALLALFATDKHIREIKLSMDDGDLLIEKGIQL